MQEPWNNVLEDDLHEVYEGGERSSHFTPNTTCVVKASESFGRIQSSEL
jgi:hypothetical protein